MKNSIAIINIKYASGTYLLKMDEDVRIHQDLKQLGFDVHLIECDDTYILGDILDELQDCNPSVCLLICEKSALQYAIRLASNIFHYNTAIKIIIQSEELKNSYKYEKEDFFFFATNTQEQTVSELTFDSKKKCETIDFSKIHPKYDHTYKLVMENGYTAYLTGIYPDNLIHSSTKHIGISDCDSVFMVQEKIKPSINSAIILENEGFDKNKYLSLIESSQLLSHFHFNDEPINVSFDNSKMKSNFEFVTFKEFVNHKRKSEKRLMISIDDYEDYNLFFSELMRFFEKGKIEDPNFFLINECRFTGNCQLNKLHRYRIDNGAIYPCRSLNLKVANVGDSRLKVLSNITKIANDIQMQRKCQTCIAKDVCTKCVALDSTTDEQFCRLQKRFLNISEYISKKNMYQVLCKQSKLVSDAENILIPNKEFSVWYTGPEKGGINEPVYYLYQIDGVEYLFDIQKAVLLKIDPKLFLILEGIMRGANSENIVRSMSQVCSVSVDIGKEVYDNGVKMLKKAGVLL